MGAESRGWAWGQLKDYASLGLCSSKQARKMDYFSPDFQVISKKNKRSSPKLKRFFCPNSVDLKKKSLRYFILMGPFKSMGPLKTKGPRLIVPPLGGSAWFYKGSHAINAFSCRVTNGILAVPPKDCRTEENNVYPICRKKVYFSKYC